MKIPKNSPYYPVFSKLTDEEVSTFTSMATKLSSVIYDEWCQYSPTCSECKHRKECHAITNFTELFNALYQGLCEWN